MLRGKNTGVEEVGESLLRLTLLALLVAGLLKIVAPEFTRLRDEFGWRMVPTRAASEGDEQSGGRCREGSPASQKQDLARRQAVNPGRARRKNTVGMQQSVRRQRPSGWEADDLSVQPRGASAIDENPPPLEP
jgi:hypothetical protein